MLILLCTIDLSNKTSGNTLLIILIPSIIFATISIMIFLVLLLCVIKRMCVAKKSTSEDPNQQPTYEEITRCRKGIPMEENTAYGHVIHATKL